MWTDPILASARMRNNIPAKILRSRGVVKDGVDLIVASKHNWDIQRVRNYFPRMIFDVCDDHFEDHLKGHYLEACRVADQVTCNSEVMRGIIECHTDRRATVIDDPYEDDEVPPSDSGTGVLWFGHSLNRPDLDRVRDQIRWPLTIVDSSNYTPEYLDECLKACKAVALPTGKSMAKSANRAIRAIRYGKFPVCGYLPAFDELGLCSERPFGERIDEAISQDLSERVRGLQSKVKIRFSPETVADAWQRVICA